MTALEAYLENRKDLDALAPAILEAAESLLAEDTHRDLKIIAPNIEDLDFDDLKDVGAIADDSAQQLRLL